MQTFLAQLKLLLTDWYALTIENPLYAVALVISAWLVTVFFYSIRLYFLKRKQRAAERASIKLQSQFEEAQQQNKQSEEKLAQVTEKMVKDQQFATELSQKVEQRNQQIIDNIKQLANKFELSEQLVASDDKPKTEFVWQQQDNIQVQLTERLQTLNLEKNTLQESYKQERDLFGKQKVLIEHLQQKLDSQTSKSEQLEHELEAQKLLQEQQRNEAEQNLADKLTAAQAKHEHELNVAAVTHNFNNLKDTLKIDTEDQQPGLSDGGNKDEVSTASISEYSSESQTRFFEPEIKLPEEELIAEIEPEVIENKSEVEMLEPSISVKQEEQVALTQNLDAEQDNFEPDYTKSNLDVSGKFISLFDKVKKKTDTTQPSDQTEVMASEVAVSKSEEPEWQPDYRESNLNITGKFKNLFAKNKKQVDKTETKLQTELTEAEASDAVPELEKAKVVIDPTKSNRDITGKLTSLFTKEKKQPSKIEAETQIEADIAAVRESEDKEKVYEPDYGKSNFKIPGKVKNLFGKGK